MSNITELELNSLNFDEESRIDKENEKDDFIINIFRYKFNNDFINPLYQFSKIHQYDHRKDFKEAWKIWIEENDDLVCKEVKRLSELDYKELCSSAYQTWNTKFNSTKNNETFI